MKNILITLLAVVLFTPVFAQIPKGTSTIGGNISLQRSTTQYTYDGSSSLDGFKTEYKTNILALTPSYGYFIVNNLSLGVNVNTFLSRATSKPYADVRDLHSDSRTIGVGPMVRYYLPLDSKLYLFGTASYSWLWSHSKYENYDNTRITTSRSSVRYTMWDAGLGLSYFVSPTTAVEAGATYSQLRYKNDDTYTADQEVNKLAFNLGFRVFLRKG